MYPRVGPARTGKNNRMFVQLRERVFDYPLDGTVSALNIRALPLKAVEIRTGIRDDKFYVTILSWGTTGHRRIRSILC